MLGPRGTNFDQDGLDGVDDKDLKNDPVSRGTCGMWRVDLSEFCTSQVFSSAGSDAVNDALRTTVVPLPLSICTRHRRKYSRMSPHSGRFVNRREPSSTGSRHKPRATPRSLLPRAPQFPHMRATCIMVLVRRTCGERDAPPLPATGPSEEADRISPRPTAMSCGYYSCRLRPPAGRSQAHPSVQHISTRAASIFSTPVAHPQASNLNESSPARLTMRAYFMDDLPGDQRLAHDSGVEATDEVLNHIGVLHWHIPVDPAGQWERAIEGIARERDYKNHDVVHVNKEAMGDEFETKIKSFYKEHMHEDEEIRYILEGGGYFDVREQKSDTWIRCHLGPGDMIVLPAGIYHRFGLDMGNKSRTMRLFKDEPKWLAHYRGAETDANPFRLDYLKTLQSVSAAA